MFRRPSDSPSTPTDAATWDQSVRPATHTPGARTSRYVVMRDGVRIAVDVTLPESLAPGEVVPAILQQTRYFRASSARRLARALRIAEHLDMSRDIRAFFVARGYAWVHACVRGSGASEGVRPFPWSEDEVADGGELLEWIVQQPWSNGRVGATGVSYDGTTAEMLLRNGHPALRAVLPRFSLFDAYADVAFPGGVHLTWFTSRWGQFNGALDENDHGAAIAGSAAHNAEAWSQTFRDRGQFRRSRAVGALSSGPARRALRRLGGLLSRGVAPVADQAAVLDTAIAQHRGNYDVHAGALRLIHRDDVGLSELRPEAPIDAFSPHRFAEELRAANVPIYSQSGWFDAGYPHAAIKRFHAIDTPGSRLILGPWDHGGGQNASVNRANHATAFDHAAELFQFLDAHVMAPDAPTDGEDAPVVAADAQPRVRYFTMGSERWQSSDTWPPEGVRARAMVLHPERLEPVAPEPNTTTEVVWDPTLGTGARSRWRTLLGLHAPVGYAPPPQSCAARRRFRSEPLAEDIEVTGHPIVTLWVSSEAADASVFAYLEYEDPDGVVTVVTEGMLRLCHRKVSGHVLDPLAIPERTFLSDDASPLPSGEPVDASFDLLPTSVMIPAGSRVCLAVALGDADHFRPVCDAPHAVKVHHGSSFASRLVLPVMTPAST